MKLKDLINHWEISGDGPLTKETYVVHLPVEDAAKIKALVEMFPGRTQDQIITELLTSALDGIEEDFPYVKGPNVIRRDEFDDPIFEDIGHTAVFGRLTQKYLQQFRDR
ncbi:MAG: hypothetical protein ACI9KN_001982 [Gammaproteobacteria bacterium]|jgi:hypothetical protein